MSTTVHWKISINSQMLVPLADKGLDIVSCEFNNLSPDILRLQFTGKKVSEEPPISTGDLVTVYKVIDDSTVICYFYGTAKFPSQQSDVRTETQYVDIYGPFEYLKNITYMQSWTTKTWVPAGGGALFGTGRWDTSSIMLPRCNLFSSQTTGGSPVSVSAQLQAILTYSGVPNSSIAFDFPDVVPPSREVNSVSCAEAIVQCMRFIPDAVMYFDYSGANYYTPPAIKITSWQKMRATTIDAVGLGDDISNTSRLQIAPVVDQQVSAVRIVYETPSPYQQFQKYENWVPSVDVYPPGASGLEYRALNYVCDLKGAVLGSGFTESNNVITEALPKFTATTPTQSDPAMNDWVFAHCDFITKGLTPDPDTGRIKIEMNNTLVPPPGSFADPLGYYNLTYYQLNPDGTRASTFVPSDTTYPNCLVQGNIMPWMQGNGVGAIRACAEFKLDYVLLNSDGIKVEVVKGAAITINFIATQAQTQVYYRGMFVPPEAAEPTPTGLAEKMFKSLNRVAYKGSISFTSAEVGDIDISMGVTLNLTGLNPLWGSMNALITKITDDVHNGIRTVAFGAPGQLSIADFVELAIPFRFRKEAQWLRQQSGFTNGENNSGQVFHPSFSAVVVGAGSDKGNKEHYGIARTF